MPFVVSNIPVKDDLRYKNSGESPVISLTQASIVAHSQLLEKCVPNIFNCLNGVGLVAWGDQHEV